MKIGRADLLIAAITLAHQATLVSRNLKDFPKYRVCALKTGQTEGESLQCDRGQEVWPVTEEQGVREARSILPGFKLSLRELFSLSRKRP